MSNKVILFLILFACYALYSFAVYTKGTEITYSPIAEQNEKTIKGKMLWQEKNCTSCHQLFGLGGYLGPELTNEMSRAGKGKLYVSFILEQGLNRMPNFHFTQDERENLIAFLEYVDKASKTSIYESTR